MSRKVMLIQGQTKESTYSMYRNIQKMLTNIQQQKADESLFEDGMSQREKGTLGSGGCVHCLDCGGSFSPPCMVSVATLSQRNS